jgi:glycosyltransferase involved in cell wall biosynthesis
LRIVIASAYVPFQEDETDRLVEDLSGELRARGLDTDVVRIPFRPEWPTIPEQTLGLRLLDLSVYTDRIDRLIAVGAPAHALRHPNKVAWFGHHHRDAYDLWGTPWGGMPMDQRGQQYRDMLRSSDTLYLRECRKVFANSQTVSRRLEQFNGIRPEGILYPPLARSAAFQAGKVGDYFLYPGRLAPLKRQDLAIEALRHTRRKIRLVLAGEMEAGVYYDGLVERVRRHGLEKRVQFLGKVSAERKADLLADCRAVLHLPYQEGCCGDTTLEACHAGRPIVTTSDSGGSLEMVADGVNGLVVAPEPLALAKALDRLWVNQEEARRFGALALQTPRRLGIDWNHAIESLTA